MDLNCSHSKLKAPALKLKSPASNKIPVSKPLVQKDVSPSSVPNSLAPEINNSAKNNEGNNLFGSGSLLPGWLKTGRRTAPGKTLSNQEPYFSNHRADDALPLANEHQPKKHLPLKKRARFSTSSNAVNTRGSTLNENLVHMEGEQSSADGSKNDEKLGHPEAGTSTDPLVNEKIDVHKIHTKSPKKYVCDICDRSFTSYQALGGHKVHHKIRVNNKEQHLEVTCSLLHECTFCDKIFPTGQALGGHKRHCRELASEEGGPHGEVQEKGNQKRVFCFDLNEPPVE